MEPGTTAADVQRRPRYPCRGGHAFTGNGRQAAGRYLGSRCQTFGAWQVGPEIRGADFQARPGEGPDVQVGVFGQVDDGVAVVQQAPPGGGSGPGRCR